MSGSFLGPGERMSFNNLQQFPTSDPVVWNIDEDAVLDELYGMLTAAETKPFNQFNHMPQIQDSAPNVNTYLPEPNKLQHFNGYKPQFPLTSNHSSSMPMLPTQDQPMKYNQIPDRNACQDYPMQQVPQQQSNGYPSMPRYPQNNTLQHSPPQIIPPQNIPPHLKNIPPSLNIPPADKISSYAPSVESTLVTFVDLKTFYEKGQCRLQGKSEQRLDYASSFVRIYLEKPNNIKASSAFVERAPDAAHILKDSVGQVPLKILPDESSNWIKVNLDDAGSEVYKLSKVKGEERNLFRIGLELLFKDTNKTKMFYSDSFQVKSKPKSIDGLCEDGEKPVIKTEPELKKRAVKRSRNDDQGQDLMMSSPLSIGSSVFPEVITDHLEATTANIKQLKVNQPIQTQRGDVAYHFKLDDYAKKYELEEGDIIGFFETAQGKSEIRRLTCDNVRHAKLAGVISRSAWLEGKTPSEDEKDPTDVVCVIGVVKVKVRGPVKNGERIYASLSSYPGVAMPEQVITQVTSEELTLIGQSLESVKESSPDAVNLVSCFVSILLSIQTQHTNKALSDMRTDVLSNVDSKISKAKKSLLRGLKWKALVLLIFFALLGVLLYQLYAPLTAYRYWKCSLGSVDGSTSSFTFTATDYQIPRVKGIEFEFHDLMDKLDADHPPISKNFSLHRYYLNLDRCAAGGLKHGVRGPAFYVMDMKCSVAYYEFDGGYNKYTSGRDFLCLFDSKEVKMDAKKAREECLSGIEEKKGEASFSYISRETFRKVHVEGIEVTVDELRKKFNQRINEAPPDKVVSYFFNLNHCMDGRGGPRFFAMSKECRSHYYSDSWSKWIKYRTGKTVKCSVKTSPRIDVKNPNRTRTRTREECLSGIEEKKGKASFSYTSYITSTKEYKKVYAEGIEVTVDELRKKFNQTINEAPPGEVVSYFFNLNHCMDGRGGPRFFAMIKECHSHYYSDSENKWIKYKTANTVECSVKTSPTVGSKSANRTRAREECLSGIEEKNRTASFSYTKYITNKKVYAEGIEVTVDELRKKFNQTINEAPPDKGLTYFFNLKLCMEEGEGPRFFAMSKDCNAHYYSDSRDKWVKYNSGKTIQCSPET